MYPEEFYEFEHLLEGLDEDIVFAVLGILGAVTFVAGLILFVGYIFQSIGCTPSPETEVSPIPGWHGCPSVTTGSPVPLLTSTSM